MKVLVSAFSCDPHRGSEPGVGWNWPAEIARRGHEVHVLTLPEHRAAIESLGPGQHPDGLHVHYHQTLAPFPQLSRLPGGVYPHIYAWQWSAARFVRRLHARIGFDLAHHITFATARFPSFLGDLDCPFVIGPVGGGERSPRALRRSLPWGAARFEDVRELANALLRYDPMVRATLRAADRVYVKTQDTLDSLPSFVREKASRASELGLPPLPPPPRTPSHSGLRLLFLGRFIHVKGMHIGLQVLREVLDQLPDTRLTMVGQGPAEASWRSLATRLGVDHAIDWLPWVAKDDVPAIYSEHDLFLFPGLHDSGATVTFEASAYGCPVVCFKLGGPGENLDNDIARIIPVEGLSEAEVARNMAMEIASLAKDTAERDRIAENAMKWASHRQWADTIAAVYEELEIWLEGRSRGRGAANGGKSA